MLYTQFFFKSRIFNHCLEPCKSFQIPPKRILKRTVSKFGAGELETSISLQPLRKIYKEQQKNPSPRNRIPRFETISPEKKYEKKQRIRRVRCQLILTGHSLGGMLAMTVAQMLPSSSRVKDVKALAFAPAPWNHLQPNLEVLEGGEGNWTYPLILVEGFDPSWFDLRTLPKSFRFISWFGPMGVCMSLISSFIFEMCWVRWVGWC